MACHEKLLWVGSHAPWSRWTYSGGAREICLEIFRRELLHSAISPDWVSRTFGSRRTFWMELLLKLQSGVPRVFPSRERWDTEEDGRLGTAIRSLPDGSTILYMLDVPRILKPRNLKRYLFLDLSAHEARRLGAFNFDRLDEEKFDLICSHQKTILSRVDGVITPSTYAADSIARDFTYPRNQITAIGCGAALPTTSLSPVKTFASNPNILFVGRDWHRKGGPLVHEAWKILRESIPDLTLTIVGPELPPTNEPGVRFIGFLDKTMKRGAQVLAEEYAAATVFCMPTLCEPWGLVFVEAMHFGVPIVSFKNWSLPDIVEDGLTGILVENQSAESLAGAMKSILNDPILRESMRIESIRRAQTTLSWSACVDRLLATVLPQAVQGLSIPSLQRTQPQVSLK